jgi:hypothetical protein
MERGGPSSLEDKAFKATNIKGNADTKGDPRSELPQYLQNLLDPDKPCVRDDAEGREAIIGAGEDGEVYEFIKKNGEWTSRIVEGSRNYWYPEETDKKPGFWDGINDKDKAA